MSDFAASLALAQQLLIMIDAHDDLQRWCIGGEVWASTEATDSLSRGQRSSVYAQITTDTVGRSGNSSPFRHTREGRVVQPSFQRCI